MKKLGFQITNSLSRKKETFIPIFDNIINMYVCGITPYDYAHIGHGRVYVTFDILYRLLKILEYKVNYCRNFTDIDDKILKKSQDEFGSIFKYQIISNKYIQLFHEDMGKLGCLRPTYEPKVTEVIPEIIQLIKELIKNKKAYVTNGNVYYTINNFPDYGKLSKRNLEDLKIGARVEIHEDKKNPLDFALWKSEPQNTFWNSPWGWGRPGWHIECSAMALKFLGKHIDIHGGGMDLIFPHHENEIAQSEALYGAPFAKYWIHNAFVRINKEKMSKSLGNFFTLKDVFEKFDPMVVRFYYINHNYNIPIDFSFEELEKTEKTYQKLCKIFINIKINKIFSYKEFNQSIITQKMLTYLCDDLNMAGMLGVIFENIKNLENNIIELTLTKAFLVQIMGLDLESLPEKTITITPEIQNLINEREIARKNKDWKTSDDIRDKLKKLGIEVHDKVIK